MMFVDLRRSLLQSARKKQYGRTVIDGRGDYPSSDELSDELSDEFIGELSGEIVFPIVEINLRCIWRCNKASWSWRQSLQNSF